MIDEISDWSNKFFNKWLKNPPENFVLQWHVML